MSSAQPEPVSSRRVDPDPSIVSAVGLRHSLPTAVADLVDNSIDAGAHDILIRFLLRRGRAEGLQIIDDGRGMDDRAVDEAMRYARKRRYERDALGHFGLGLKAASLSQVDTLMVWSRARGAPAVGRRLRRETIDQGPVVETYSGAAATRHLDALEVGHGTVVEWARPRNFLTSPDEEQQARWLEEATQRLLTHLGLVLHRLLDRNTVGIAIEQYDIEAGEAGVPRSISPIDPFDYRAWGTAPYPEHLSIVLPDGAATATMHLLPDGTRTDPAFVLDGRPATETQGLYVYRRDRLLQAGGWNGLVSASPDYDFARVAVDIDGSLERHVMFNPEKSGVRFDTELSKALHGARTSAGGGLAELWRTAKRRAKDARRRHPRPITVPEPTAGLPPAVIDAIVDNTRPGLSSPVEIRWRVLPRDEFFQVDLTTPALVLNAVYRSSVVGHRSLSNNDAPLVKALLYLLAAHHFEGMYLGSRDKREQAAWQRILISAAEAQNPKGVP